MSRKDSTLAVICGILIPVFIFSISFMLVMLFDAGDFGISAVKLSSIVMGVLSVLFYAVAMKCFKKAGYTQSALTLSYYLTFTLLIVAGFSFTSYHDFVVAYGENEATVRTAFRTCFLYLGIFTAISALIRLIMEFAGYVNKLKQ